VSDDKTVLDRLLERAEKEIAQGKASGSGVPFWAAAESALEVIKEDREAVARWGVNQFKALLGTLSRTPAKEQQLIRMMSARQLIMDMEAGTTSLREDTAIREATKEQVIEVLTKLGSIGAQLLLRVL
jgi:hypothetical protein